MKPSPILRFDGLYRGPAVTVSPTVQSVEYFRFYDDTLVVSVAATTDETPAQVATWFDRDFQGAGSGYWSREGDRISFRSVVEEGHQTIAVRWSGIVEHDALVLESKSERHSAKDMRFDFIPL